MKKLITILMLFNLFLIQSAFSNNQGNPRPEPLPEIPENCFDDDIYCVDYSIFENSDEENVIRVRIFAKLSTDDYTQDELVNRYFTFAKWPEYAAASGMDYVRFSESVELPPIITPDNKKIRRHKATYKSWSPIGWINVKELAHYRDLPLHSGLLYSLRFDPDPDFQYEGVKKSGILHIKLLEDEDEYLLYFISDSIPQINILPSVSAPYIKNGILSIFKGMFNL